MFKQVIKTILCSLLVLSFVQPAFSKDEIGVIDNAKILENFKESQDAQKKIIDAREKLQKSFTDLSAELEKTLQDKALSEAQKLQKRKDAQEKLELEKKKVDTMIATLRNDIETKVVKAISDEASAQGLSMVVSKNVIFFGGKDITEQVLKRLK